MQDVDARAGPFGEDRGAADRLDRDHRRARGEMRQRIVAARVAELRLAPLHDRVGLGMQRDALAGRRHDLECLQHRAGRGRRNFAEGVAHIELEADHAAVDQRADIGDGLLAEQTVEPVIDMRLGRGDGVLFRENLCRSGRRNRVRHVEHSGHAAEGRRRRAARPVFLVRIAGIAEMHMHVDRAGQDMEAGGIERLARGRHRLLRADRENFSVLHGDARRKGRIRRHHHAVANDEIGCGHGIPHSIAQPPSTGRSAPVIWRDTSLAKNRQAFATSVSSVTRLSA